MYSELELKRKEHFDFISEDIYLELFILDYLKIRDYYITANEIAGFFNITYKKSSLLLNNLKEKLEKYTNKMISNFYIDFLKGKGYCLFKSNETDIVSFKAYIIFESPLVKLLNDIILNEINSIPIYCQDHFISESKFRKDLAKLKESVERYGIQIDNNFDLKGNEANIRYFIYLFYWKTSRTSWPFHYIEEQKIISTINDWGYIEHLNSIEKRKIAYFLVIFRLRNVQKHSITTDDYPTLEEYSFLTFKETCRCIDFFTTYNNNELSFLFDLFKGFNWVQDIYLCYEEERSINSQAAIQTDNFIELYEKHWFSIDAMYYTEAVSYIYSIHKLVGIAPNLEIDLNGNYYGRYLQFHFPNLYKEIKKFIDLLAKRTNSELFNAYNFLAVNYTMLFYYLEKQCYYEEKIIILLETEMPKIVNLQYKKKIEEALREFYNINVLLAGEVGPLDTVNLIVTTMSIDSLTKDYGRVPTILISREITLYDISMIQKAIGKL